MQTKDIGVIFDMDGTLINNMAYHVAAFHVFFKKYGISMSDEDFLRFANGRTNDDVMRHLFGSDTSQARVIELTNEKEGIYRDLYRPHLQLSSGLQPLLDDLYSRQIPMAVGSSAIDDNIDFVLDGLHIRHYFKAVINASQVQHGKPHPEVFLKAAAALGCAPQRCLVFEDAAVGIDAARAAGAKAVGITSVMSRQALRQADLVIDSFTQINIDTVFGLFAAQQ